MLLHHKKSKKHNLLYKHYEKILLLSKATFRGDYRLISYYYDEQAVVVESWLASMSPKAENKQLLQEIKLAFVELRNNTKVFMDFLEKCSSVVTRERMLAAIGAFATERNRASTVLFEKLLNIS